MLDVGSQQSGSQANSVLNSILFTLVICAIAVSLVLFSKTPSVSGIVALVA